MFSISVSIYDGISTALYFSPPAVVAEDVKGADLLIVVIIPIMLILLVLIGILVCGVLMHRHRKYQKYSAPRRTGPVEVKKSKMFQTISCWFLYKRSNFSKMILPQAVTMFSYTYKWVLQVRTFSPKIYSTVRYKIRFVLLYCIHVLHLFVGLVCKLKAHTNQYVFVKISSQPYYTIYNMLYLLKNDDLD